MELKKIWMVSAVMLLLVSEWKSSNGCLDHEKIALLKLRPIFEYQFPSEFNPLLDWGHNSDCCQWNGVICDNSTKNVIKLDLSPELNDNFYNWYYDSGKQSKSSWYIHLTMFLPFTKLQALSMRGYSIAGFFKDEGLESLSQLEYLDLSYNNFNISTMSSLSAISTLKNLSLSGNDLQGTLYLEEGLERLSQLEYLDLSWNFFNNSIMSSLSALSTLKNLSLSFNDLQGTLYLEDFKNFASLKYLDLSENGIESIKGSIPSLKILNLAENAFQGTIHIQADSLLNLEELDISGTSIKEFLTPKGDKSFSKLEILYMESVHTDNIIKLLQSMGPLPFVKTLYLASNTFNETTTTMSFSNFKKLEVLDMSDSMSLNSKFLQSIQHMNALKVLKLTDSGLNGTLLSASQGLCNSRYLEVLDLRSNNFTGTLPACLANLTSLQTLDLSSNQITGDVACLANLTSLQTLDLSDNQITGDVACLANLTSLQTLDLSDNQITGDVACLANLTSLQTLDLSHNQITGDLAESPITSMKSLQALSLSNTHFKIPISFGSLYNHSKLKNFEGENILIYDDPDPQSLFPKFQLSTIRLSGHGNVRAFPKFLCYQRDLEVVYINDAHFKGEFPNCLLDNNTRLNKLDLRNNSLSRLSDFSNRSHAHLEFFDVSNNLFNGGIPLDFGVSFPNLRSLNMSSNQFDGHIPSSFGDMSLLETLDISNNKLFGKMPKRLGIGCVALGILVLSHNSLEGKIFSGDFNLTGLWELHLEGNNFSGRIPDSLSIATELSVLDISSNNLSGPLPKWMGKMSYLWNLKMSKNHLEGPIPLEFCQLKNLQVLDLSENDISGMIPSCFNPPHIQTVRLSKNKLQGTLEHALSGSSSMRLLDLSNNQLTRSIPTWIHRLSLLNFLLLNNNNLGGEIPIQLCQLDHLSLINLSHNDLYGTIPDCLCITPIAEQNDIDGVEDPREVPNADAPAPTTASGPSTGTFGPATALGPATFAPSQDESDPTSYDYYDVTMDVEFPTKRTSYDYQGDILNMMSGIDLSCNKFFGEIPPQLGNLNGIRALNLSHNNLSGSIPPTFGNLKQVESLDLSDNLLIGKIPQELGGLSSLAVFSVANNNLSGEIPTTTQFTTFNESSYQGNHLCGAPLPKSCDDRGPESPRALVNNGEDGGFMDMECFYASFGASYLTVLLGLVAVLLINPYWRRWWFYRIEKWTNSSYYFVVDNLPKRFFTWKV